MAIAHRGGGGLAAENTLAAFALSHALGVRYLETDVRLTRDGIPVLFHDADLRLAGRRRALSTLEYHDLPLPIPTLEAALRCFPDAGFTIDIKDNQSIAQVAAVLQRTGAAHRICIGGAWDGTLAQLAREVGPDLSVAMGWRALVRLITCSHSRLPLLRRGRPAFAHVPLQIGRLPIFADRVLRRAHELGVRVIVWTVNEPPTMHRLLDAGVDGVITDRPDLLRDVLISRDQWAAPLHDVRPTGVAEPA
jgi:glycerophosphoryl diester phosphodiesterase